MIVHKTEPPWFEERVSNLKPGGKVRLDDSRLVSFNGKGYFLYDFREKQPEVYEPQMTLAEKLEVQRLQREADLTASASAALPSPRMDHVRDWPLEARVWFYKAGINNQDIQEIGAYWNPVMRRVIVPYMTVTGDKAWIGRNVGLNDGPKYLFPAGVSRGGGAEFGWEGRRASGVVIVEDVLSAYRVWTATDITAVAAQGTSLDRDAITRIAEADTVYVWLDPDKYGQAGAAKLRDEFARRGVVVRNIVSKVDPKFIEDDAEIRRLLS